MLKKIKIYFLVNKFIKKFPDIYIFFIEKKIIIDTFDRKLLRTSSNEKGSYLLYYRRVHAGISHVTNELDFFLQESVLLNRTAVLTKPSLTERHNNNVTLNSSWYKYYDIDKSLQEMGCSYIDYENFSNKQFTKKEVLMVSATTKITAAQNQRYKLIIRVLNYTTAMVFQLGLLSGKRKTQIFYPSKKITEEAQKVQDKLPADYCAIHIRRRDRLSTEGIIEDTSAHKVLQKLRKHNPHKLPVFLMTDEPNKEFYKNLESEFQIYRYHNFANLIQIRQRKR